MRYGYDGLCGDGVTVFRSDSLERCAEFIKMINEKNARGYALPFTEKLVFEVFRDEYEGFHLYDVGIASEEDAVKESAL